MSNSFKDLFSTQASDYAKYRPTYPPELFDYLASLAAKDSMVWDCGTGNGQAAVELARRFSKVFATDPSEKQLQSATPAPNILYSCASAEHSGLPDHSVALVTVAQAFHWFKHDQFFNEVKRVSKPGAVLAVWCYALAHISPKVDAVVMEFYRGLLDSYWEPERRLVEEGYCSIAVPFQELTPPAIQMQADWTLDQLLGYFQTWSAFQSFVKKNGEEPIVPYFKKITAVWNEDGPAVKRIRWPLSMRIFKISSSP